MQATLCDGNTWEGREMRNAGGVQAGMRVMAAYNSDAVPYTGSVTAVWHDEHGAVRVRVEPAEARLLVAPHYLALDASRVTTRTPPPDTPPDCQHTHFVVTTLHGLLVTSTPHWLGATPLQRAAAL